MLVPLFRIAGLLLSILPNSVIRFLSIIIGTFFYWKSASAGKVLLANLEIVFKYLNKGSVKKADLNAVFINYTQYFLEVLKLPFWPQSQIRQIPVEGAALLKKGLNQGKGVIILTAHFGNWDLAGAVTAQYCEKFYALAEKLGNVQLMNFFIKTRAAKLVQVIPSTHSAYRESKKVLEQNQVIAILGDRDMSGKGIPVQLFGKPTTLPAGPALLAYETGCMLLPGFLWRTKGKYQTIGFEPIEFDRNLPQEEFLKVIAQQIARRIEKIIAHDPLQWCMLQPIWKNP